MTAWHFRLQPDPTQTRPLGFSEPAARQIQHFQVSFPESGRS